MKVTAQPKRQAAKVAPIVRVRLTQPADGGSNGQSLFVLSALALAIACLTLAVVPGTRVPWRAAAILVNERRTDLTVVGLAFLVAAACAFLWMQGP